MADLDFSHNVSEIPAGQSLPQPYQRQVGVEKTSTPDLQSAISNYADSTNWMSAIGSNVAARASNALATKLGTEIGKNPQGDIGFPITDFDKTMRDSYNTQAQATLGLQANKLISDSNLELAKMPRLSPDLIAKTQQSISVGLKNILAHAPPGVQENLENHYGNVQLDQTTSLTERMIREQKEDQRENTVLSSSTLSEHAYSFGINGNDKAGLNAIETVKKLNNTSVAARNGITPEQAKENVDTVRKSYLTGKYVGEYKKAQSENKGEAYLKSLADKKPADLSDNDYNSVTNNVLQYANHQEALRSQDQQLQLAKFNADVSLDPTSPDIASKLQELKANVTQEQFEKAQEGFIKTVRRYNKEEGETNSATASWSNIDLFNRLSDKAINGSYNQQVNKYVQDSQDEGSPVTQAEAELHVAASAAGAVPQFVKTLNAKGSSTNPQLIEEFGASVEKMYDIGQGQNISKVEPMAIANYEKYSVLKNGGMNPVEAAQQAHEIVYGKTPEQKKANDEAWTDYVKHEKSSGTTDKDFFIEASGLSKDAFVRNGQAYSNQMRTTYESYFKMLNGDGDTAKKMLQRTVEQNYGYTNINGVKEYTFAPINKVLNLPEGQEGVVHTDLAEQLNSQFASTNIAYEEGKSDWHWEIKPQMTVEEAISKENIPVEFKNSQTRIQGAVERNIDRFNKQNNVEVHKIYRDGRVEKYNAIIQANPYASRTLNPSVPLLGGWDVMLSSKNGISTIHSLDPRVGSITYSPNVSKINSDIKRLHQVRYGA